jgi:hypothetical protein
MTGVGLARRSAAAHLRRLGSYQSLQYVDGSSTGNLD